MSPLCTIVITTKNRPDFVRRAVQSALDQTVDRLEVLVVDDGSVPPYEPPRDERVRVVRQETSVGVSAARNLGLNAAAGEWISFLDDDDRLDPEYLELSLAAARKSLLPCPVCVMSGIRRYINDTAVPGSDLYPVSIPKGGHYFLERDRLTTPGSSFRAHATLVAPTVLLRDIGGWDEQIRAWVHNDLFLRLNAAASIEAIPRVLYLVSEHSGPRRSASMADTARGIERTIKKHSAVIAGYPGQLAGLLDAAALGYLEGGSRRGALRVAARSVALSPWRLRSWMVLATVIGGPRLYEHIRT